MTATFGTYLRFAGLLASVPSVLGTDEPAVFDRSNQLLDGTLPDQYDWPTGSMLYLGAVRGTFAALGLVSLDDVAGGYRLGRVAFAILTPLLIVATFVLAREFVRDTTEHRGSAWVAPFVASLLVAVGFQLVRIGRTLTPDILQAILVTISVWLALRYDRCRTLPWLLGAAAAAGLAFGMKYVGGLAVVPIVLSVLTGGHPFRRQIRLLAASAAAFVIATVAMLPAVLVRFSSVWNGVTDQFTHQSGGHLGYEGSGPSWMFHLLVALPGAWGWPVTLLAAGGVAIVAVKGTRAERLTLSFLVPAFLVMGASSVRLPHYVIVYLPILAVMAAVSVDRVRTWLPPRWSAAVAVVVLLGVAPTIVDDLRLINVAGAPRTTEQATEFIASLEDDVFVESFVTTSIAKYEPGETSLVRVTAINEDIIACDECTIVTSSFMEERFAREPDRYATQLVAYDALRARGRVLAEFSPERPLSYRWDQLPRYGIGEFSPIGSPGTVGPRITVYALD